MIPTGKAGRPGFGLTLSAGAEVMGVEFVEAGAGQAEFDGGGTSAEKAGAMRVEEMTDQRSRQPVDELCFFMRGSVPEKKGFFALELTPAGGMPGRAQRPDLPYARLQAALRLRPRRALSSAEATNRLCRHDPGAIVSQYYSGFVRTRPSGFVRTTTGQSVKPVG